VLFPRSLQRAGVIAFGSLLAISGLYAIQPFREYPGVEYENFPIPPDWNERTEWVFARLMYPPGPNDGYRGRFDGDWRQGLSLWTQDYPRADRQFSEALRHLTRIHARSVEEPVNLEDGDEVYNWPWLYAVQVGEWGLTPAQGKVLREYLLRGGFFMADDFHGTLEWQVFEQSMRLVFPDRPIVDIPDADAIFHTVYDLNERYQVPGAAHLRLGYKNDGIGAHWRAIYDGKGRMVVAIHYNMDIGDAWEEADVPEYPAESTGLAYRFAINSILYAMTH